MPFSSVSGRGAVAGAGASCGVEGVGSYFTGDSFLRKSRSDGSRSRRGSFVGSEDLSEEPQSQDMVAVGVIVLEELGSNIYVKLL